MKEKGLTGKARSSAEELVVSRRRTDKRGGGGHERTYQRVRITDQSQNLRILRSLKNAGLAVRKVISNVIVQAGKEKTFETAIAHEKE